MADEIQTGTPTVSLGGLSLQHVDDGLKMYAGIFKHATQAAGKGLKTAANKMGELKDATLSRAGQIKDRVAATVKPQSQKLEKPITPRQELHIAQGPEALRPVQSMNPVQLRSVDELFSKGNDNYVKHNISHVNVTAHEMYAHQFTQATAVGQAQAQQTSMAR